jgi:hypothetical protein
MASERSIDLLLTTTPKQGPEALHPGHGTGTSNANAVRSPPTVSSRRNDRDRALKKGGRTVDHVAVRHRELDRR